MLSACYFNFKRSKWITKKFSTERQRSKFVEKKNITIFKDEQGFDNIIIGEGR